MNKTMLLLIGIILTVLIWGTIAHLLKTKLHPPILINKNCIFLIDANCSVAVTDSSLIDKDSVCAIVVDENKGVAEVYNYGKLGASQPDPEKRPKLVYGNMGPGLTKEELSRLKAIESDEKG